MLQLTDSKSGHYPNNDPNRRLDLSDRENNTGKLPNGILLKGKGNEPLNGGMGADTLFGSSVDDEIIGRGGDDILYTTVFLANY